MMKKQNQNATLIAQIVSVIEDNKYTPVALSIGDQYPEKKSINVEFKDLENASSDLPVILTEDPEEFFKGAEDAIKEVIDSHRFGIDDAVITGMRVHFRVTNAPITCKIREIRSNMLNTLITIEGIAKRVTEVRPTILIGSFKCMRCGHITEINQAKPILYGPLECSKDEQGGGGCGRFESSTRFEIYEKGTVRIDSQKIEVQESPEGLKGGSQPQTIVCQMVDDICGYINAGDRVTITGTLRALQKMQGKHKMTAEDIYIEVNYIDIKNIDTDVIEISKEEQEIIDDLRNSPDVRAKLVESIAPSIYGYEHVKRAIMLLLFGGVSKLQPDGTRIRGDSHCLLIGDPATAKTQLLRYVATLVPRGVYASGKSSSGVGLTASATRDDFGEGRWTLEAGALVLADNGMACVDELDKMSPEDRSTMHEALESQTISVNKATIHATLNSRCSLLAGANPKHGRFDIDEELYPQIELEPTLISRFDLIFPITDVPEKVKDQKIAHHILQSHLAGSVKKRMDNDIEIAMDQGIQDALLAVKPVINASVMRKYVFLAKKIIPIMTQEAMDQLELYYVSVRKMRDNQSRASVPITARQLEGLIRLSESSARARMSDTVTIDDVDYAIDVMKDFLDRMARNHNSGIYDIDRFSGAESMDQRTIMHNMVSIIEELSLLGPFTYDKFLDEAKSDGMPEKKVDAYWENLRRDGIVFQTGSENGKALWRSIRK